MPIFNDEVYPYYIMPAEVLVAFALCGPIIQIIYMAKWLQRSGVIIMFGIFNIIIAV